MGKLWTPPGSTPPEKPTGPVDPLLENRCVEFYADLVNLGMFFGQVIATPNMLVQSLTLEVDEGTIRVMDGAEGAPVEKTGKGHYLRMKGAVAAQDAETKEVTVVPIMVSITMPIPTPTHKGKIAGFPAHQMLAVMAEYTKMPDEQRPEFLRVNFHMEKNLKGEIVGVIDCKACNQNGGLVQINQPEL